MQTYLSLYSSYIVKIGLFFKNIIIINILFISLAYPLSNTSEASSLYLKVNEENTDSIIMQKAFEAELLFKEQKYLEAAKIYHNISMKSDDPEVAKRATQLAGYANDFKLMLKSSERWLDIASDKVEVRHIRISIYLALNMVKEATQETLSAIKISKDRDKFALVYDTIKVFNDKAVKQIFDSVFEKYKDEYLANFYYVQILLDNKKYKEVVKIITTIESFKEFSKKESRWGIFLADAYYELGEEKLSIETLKDYLHHSPKNLNLNEYYVRLLTIQKKYAEAIEHYRFMSANKLISFSNSDTSKKMALLNIEAKKFSDAKTFINSIKEKDINSYNFLYGLLNVKMNKNNSAENYFKNVEVDNINYINSIKEIADIKIKDRNFSSLKKFFSDQYKKIQNNQNIESRLILIETEIFFNQDEFDYAMERINYGIKKYKDNGAFLYTRALVAEKIDRFDLMESDLKKLIKLEPKNAQAMNALGYTWANNNMNLNEANLYIDEALKIEPNDPAILDSKGWVLYRLGNYKEAEKYLMKAFKLNNDPEIVSHVIQLLVKLGRNKEANKIFKEHIKLNPKDKKLIELKKILNEI